VSSSNHLFRAGRRAALLAAALACACALLATLIARDANAAVTNTARPGHSGAASHLKMPMAKLGQLRASASSEHTVNFRNSYGKTVSVAIMRYNPNLCASYGGYETSGWLNLAPGEVKQAFTTSYRYAAYYARAVDGAEWTGDRGPVYIYNHGFDSCINIGSTDASGTVNMKLIDLLGTKPNYTLNLIPTR
jgi:hypothetical protein